MAACRRIRSTEALTSKKCDLVAEARPLLPNPDLIETERDGWSKE